MRFPCDVVSFSRSCLSSSLNAFWFCYVCSRRFFRFSSSCLYSFDKTLPKSCYSSPFWVTVKSIIVVFAESSGEKCGFGSLQNKNILKLSLNSNRDSWIRMYWLFLPFLIIYFSRIGSRIWSTSFSMPTIRRVLPSSKQYRRIKSLNRLFLSVDWHSFGSNDSAYLFLIHSMPCSCGSIKSGYLFDLVTMIPF